MSQVKLPKLHAGQVAILNGSQRFNWLAAGRRWFKTTLLMSLTVEQAAQGASVLWCAPTYDQARITFEGIQRMAYPVVTGNISRMEQRFRGGGRVLFRSMDNPDNARGHTADGVILDEAAQVKAAAWYEVLRPMLITTKGWAWGIGTPRGHNWFWAQHQSAPDRADTAAWRVPTVGAAIIEGRLVRQPHPLENPHIPWSEIEDMWRKMPERTFRQEILAEFSDESGGVFRGVRAASTLAPQAGPLAEHRYAMGIDWGRQDFTVLSVIDCHTHEQVAIDRFNEIGWDLQRRRVKAMAERWQPSPIIAEENSIGGPNIEALRAEGLAVRAFTTTAHSKIELINSASLEIERGRLRLLADPVQIGELESYEQQRLPSGAFRYSAPEGGHDDTVIALCLAWHGVQYGGIRIGFV